MLNNIKLIFLHQVRAHRAREYNSYQSEGKIEAQDNQKTSKKGRTIKEDWWTQKEFVVSVENQTVPVKFIGVR